MLEARITVSIVTRPWAGQPVAGQDFSLGSGAHPASYSKGTGFLSYSLGGKRSEREADHAPPSSAEVKNAWDYISTPHRRLHGIVLSLPPRI
jgi:hypothetical protein